MAGPGTICADGSVIFSGVCPPFGVSPLDDAEDYLNRANAAKKDADADVQSATTNLANAKTKNAAALTNYNSAQGKAYPADALQAVNCNQAAVANWTTVLTSATEKQKLAEAAVKEVTTRRDEIKQNAKVKQLEDVTIPWSYDLYQAAKKELQPALESMNLALLRYASADQSYNVALTVAENASVSAAKADRILAQGGLNKIPGVTEIQKACDTLKIYLDMTQTALNNARKNYESLPAPLRDMGGNKLALQSAENAYAEAKSRFDGAHQLLVTVTYGNDYKKITKTGTGSVLEILQGGGGEKEPLRTDIDINPQNWK